MPMPGPSMRDPDKDFRLLLDEISNLYYIQKKRFFFGWKFIKDDSRRLSFSSEEQAKKTLDRLRKDNRTPKVKGRYSIIDA